MSSRQSDVFISYSSADKIIADRLALDLKKAGISVWYDKFQLKAGDPLLHSIREGIERSDTILALVSANSIASKWVTLEIREALEKHVDSKDSAIIPIRIDDAKLPVFLQSKKFVDIRSDYAEGLSQLLLALEAKASTERVRDVIDSAGLAEELAKDRTLPRGTGFYVTTILGILTVFATLFTAWPAFTMAFGERPKLFYSITQSRLSIPKSLEGDRIRQILREEGIPDSNVRIQLINRGGKGADEIKIGLAVEGSLSSFASDPDPATNPVWVTITPPKMNSDDKTATLILNDLVPDRTFSAEYAYHADSDVFTCDIVADGLLANKVTDISVIPQWSLWQEIKTPIAVLLVGLVLSVVIGVFVASLANKKFRQLALEVVSVVSPGSAQLLALITSFTKHDD